MNMKLFQKESEIAWSMTDALWKEVGADAIEEEVDAASARSDMEEFALIHTESGISAVPTL